MADKTANMVTKITLDGEKEYKNACAGINASVKTLGSEMKLISATYADNANSVEALRAKQDTLKKTYEEQARKAEEAKAMLKLLAENGFEATSDKVQKYQRDLNYAQIAMLNAKKSVKDIDGELKKSKINWDALGGAVGKGAKAFAAGVGVISAAAGALAIKLGKEVVGAFAEFEQLVGGVETLFGGASQAVQGYAANAFKTAGMSANESVTGFSASLIQSLGGDTAKAAQVADMAITDMADNANKMGSDISSIQTAYQGFAKQTYGMLDNLKLGYGGTKQEMERLLADAEKISGVEYDLSSFSDITEAIHVIQTEMGITGTTAKEASETISGSISGMQSSITNLITGLGNADADITNLVNNVADAFETVVNNIAPVIENLVAAMPQAVETIAGAGMEMAPTLLNVVTTMFEQILNTIANLLPALIPVAVDALMTIIEAIVNNAPLLLEAASQLFTALIAGVGEAAPRLIPAAVDAAIIMAQGLIDNIPLFIDAAIQLIEGLVTGVIDAIPLLIAALPRLINSLVTALLEATPQIIDAGIRLLVALIDALPEIIAAIVEAIPLIVSGVTEALIDNLPLIIDAGVRLFTALIDNLPEITMQIVDALPSIITAIVNGFVDAAPRLIKIGADLITSIVKNWPEVKEKILAALGEIILKMIEAFKDLDEKMKEIGQKILDGVWQGIQNGAKWIKDKIMDFFSGIVDGVKNRLGIHSPSTVFAEIGENMALGTAQGVEDNADVIARAIERAIEKAEEAALQTKIDASDAYIAEEERKQAAAARVADIAGKERAIAEAKKDKDIIKAREELNEALEKYRIQDLKAERDALKESLAAMEKARKEREKAEKEAKKAYEDAMKARINIVKEFGVKEVKTAFEGHETKIKLFDEEYIAKVRAVDDGLAAFLTANNREIEAIIEKMALTDAEAAKRLQNIQKRRSAIQAESDAEKAARDEKAKAEKDAAMKRKIYEAETWEDSAAAEKEYIEWLEEEEYKEREAARQASIKDLEKRQKEIITRAREQAEQAEEEAAAILEKAKKSALEIAEVKPLDTTAVFKANIQAFSEHGEILGATFDKTLTSGMDKNIAAVTKEAKKIADSVAQIFRDARSAFVTIGGNLMSGLRDGLESQRDRLTERMRDIMESVAAAAKEEMQINSPSKVFAEIGSFMAAGIGVGFAGAIRGIERDIRNSMPGTNMIKSGGNAAGAAEHGKISRAGNARNEMQVVQNFYTPNNDYARQQREAARQFKLIARMI
jgi:phage-related protein